MISQEVVSHSAHPGASGFFLVHPIAAIESSDDFSASGEHRALCLLALTASWRELSKKRIRENRASS